MYYNTVIFIYIPATDTIKSSIITDNQPLAVTTTKSDYTYFMCEYIIIFT